MDFSIVTVYPIWLSILCLIVAGLYAVLFYRKDKRLAETPQNVVKIMTAIRFIVVFILSFLLLRPLIKSVTTTIEKPVIVIAQDNSESVLMNKDSAFYRNEYSEQLKKFASEISASYDVNQYAFGEDFKKTDVFDFNEKYTDFSELFDEIQVRYQNRNIGALIIASDGIYNKGTNPLYSAGATDFPVYTVALGDTSIRKDIIMSDIKVNKIAFLGNKFPIRVQVDAKDLKGKKTKLEITTNKEVIYKQDINFTSPTFTQVIDIELEAKETGLRHYKISLLADESEINTKNNVRDVVIDIIDSKQKVLIVANSPHPDAGAIKTALELNRNFDVDYTTIDKLNKAPGDYNLVILHQLPSYQFAATRLLEQIFKDKTPVLFILGGLSSINNLNNLKTGLAIKERSSNFDEAQAIFNPKFSLFELSEDIKKFVSEAPPLVAPFGDYQIHTVSEVLFNQKINNIETQIPLIVFKPDNVGNDNKVGFIAGEGIWRWQLFDYRLHENHELFNELINKIIQYMALRVKKDNLNVNFNNIYNENEAVTFEAEVYNQSFELVDNAEVSIEIYSADNKSYNFNFSGSESGAGTYHLNAGTFPVGDYSFDARANIGNKAFQKTGRFTVIPVDMEATRTIAQHHVLYQLSKSKNGKMYFPRQLDELAKEIKANEEIVSVSFTEKSLKDIINIKLIFVILLVLLSAEWFMRKYFGSY